MEKAVNSVRCIAKVRKKLRKIAKLNKFSKLKYELDEAQKRNGLNQRKVLQEVKTRFTSTQTMFESVMGVEKNKTEEEKIEKAKLNIKAVNEALEKVGSKELKLTSSEIEVVISTSFVLEPICDMLTVLGGEKYVTGAIVLPYMKKVVGLTRVSDTDPVFIAELKRFINKDFLQRCRVNLNFGLLKRATFFHPTYKAMKSIEESQRLQLRSEIKAEMESLVMQKSSVEQRPKPENKRRRLVLESDDEDEEPVAATLDVELELEKYAKEPKLDEQLDPLPDFWKEREALYPRLSILAKKYLAVQASSSPSERVVSKLNNVVSKKRSKLTPGHTNQTIFLSKRL